MNNRGARTSGDTGYSVELTAGQTLDRGDWRFGYGYSVAEVDRLNRLRFNLQVEF